MKSLNFENAEFILSVLDHKLIPSLKNDKGELFPKIAIFGKSNVGKSSLINHLINKKNLAFISSKPGKTKTINFFKIDNKVLLLDFPGYGFALQSLKLKQKWATNFDIFLNMEENIKLVLLLIDSRRGFEKEDELFYKWAESKNIFCGIILTKADKLKKNELQINLSAIQQKLQLFSNPPLFLLPYSINEPSGKKILLAKIKTFLGGL
jgi:GTP-binding protein